MIRKRDIETYFDKEYEEQKKQYDKLMCEELSERVRRRKAVNGLNFVELRGRNDDGMLIIKLKYQRNLSDFKEGDCVLLHNSYIRLECQIGEFIGDNMMTVAVFPPNMPQAFDWKNKGVNFILDKACVDLRFNVYNYFLSRLSLEVNDWSKHVVNKGLDPMFDDIDQMRKEIDELEESMKVKLTSKQKEALVKCAAAENGYLIQGPPGTGKSFVLAIAIFVEMYFNKKVVVIGPNHMAVNNVLRKFVEMFPFFRNLIFKIGQFYNTRNLKVDIEEETFEIQNIAHAYELNGKDILCASGPLLLGMTPHALCTSRARGMKFDVLVIDEAGQETIPLALIGMLDAKKIIMAGDHKQLPPIISSDVVSDELKVSIFERMMSEDNCTMLDISYRMRGPICKFVSDLFYEGRLKPFNSQPGDRVICSDKLYSFDSPVVLCNVEGSGKQVCEQESDKIVSILEHYHSLGLTADDIAVISPFRAQMAQIRRGIRKNKHIDSDFAKEIVVDTIDRMQGQEREVIILSTVSGDVEYMTEMGDFLYNPHKLNVAFSRAISKLIIVGNITNMRLVAGEFPLLGDILNSEHVEIV